MYDWPWLMHHEVAITQWCWYVISSNCQLLITVVMIMKLFCCRDCFSASKFPTTYWWVFNLYTDRENSCGWCMCYLFLRLVS